jgi:hypothetical protein
MIGSFSLQKNHTIILRINLYNNALIKSYTLNQKLNLLKYFFKMNSYNKNFTYKINP